MRLFGQELVQLNDLKSHPQGEVVSADSQHNSHSRKRFACETMGGQCTNELIDAFNEYFQLIIADTPELKEEVFRLRYQVYCQEIKLPGFESWKFPRGLEIDEYDADSVHCLLRHRPSGKMAGTVRLVLADPDNPNRPFPIEACAARYFDRNLVDPASLPRRNIAEISRLILAKDFRSRKGERRTAYGADNNVSRSGLGNERRHFPHPILGLFVAVVRMSAERGISYWYAAMEPILNRLLRRFKLDLTSIGPVMEYSGPRQPHLDSIDHVLAKAYERHREVWELLTDCGKVWSAP